uniref:hypothetical protein n=1 Tax=Desulfosporosinus sp. FKB TaxID=1969835 RepID=UPI001A9A44D4
MILPLPKGIYALTSEPHSLGRSNVFKFRTLIGVISRRKLGHQFEFLHLNSDNSIGILLFNKLYQAF